MFGSLLGGPGRRRGRLAAVAAVAAGSLILAGCSGTSSSGTSGGAASHTPSIAISNALSSLAPQNICTNPIISLTYEPLINVSSDGKYRPGLAASWAYSDDNKTFTLKLRTDAKFADGTAVDATAVVNSLKWYQENPGLIQGYMKPITSITATDSSTAVIRHDTAFNAMETL